jgi:hypothetical protein
MYAMGISILIYKVMKEHTCAGWCLFPLVLHLLCHKFSCCTIDLNLNWSEFHHFVRLFVQVTETHSELLAVIL